MTEKLFMEEPVMEEPVMEELFMEDRATARREKRGIKGYASGN